MQRDSHTYEVRTEHHGLTLAAAMVLAEKIADQYGGMAVVWRRRVTRWRPRVLVATFGGPSR